MAYDDDYAFRPILCGGLSRAASTGTNHRIPNTLPPQNEGVLIWPRRTFHAVCPSGGSWNLPRQGRTKL